MKLIATTLMMTILCLMPLRAQDRDNIDGNLRVKYTYFFKMDSTKRGFLADSSMCLDLIGNEAAFYSEKCFIVDSSLSTPPCAHPHSLLLWRSTLRRSLKGPKNVHGIF